MFVIANTRRPPIRMDSRMTRRTAASTGTRTKKPSAPDLTEVTSRHIKPDVTAMLWGRAAGRCEFWGCNTPLWKSLVTQERVNRAQRAHIYAFSGDGPRGHRGIPLARLNDIDNLMLVCHGCHRKIDQHQDGGRYPATLLKEWKALHERRVEIVTGIDPAKKSTVLLYQVNIGRHSKPLQFEDAANALFPRLHPADDRGIRLGTVNSSFTEKSPPFWNYESENLRNQYSQLVRGLAANGHIDHLSVFAIAPQPLLILLGSQLNDIGSAEVFQLHREPQTWSWPARAGKLEFRVERPASFTGTPALVVALSSPVADDRITGVLKDAAIWRVTVPRPNMDLIKSREHLSAFRDVIRTLLDEITFRHGAATPIHVFPVAGVSAAVELGRVRMPKAQAPWQLYDQVGGLGFVPAFTLSDQES